MKKTLFFVFIILAISISPPIIAHASEDLMMWSNRYSHSPIHITSNVEFTLANGVSGGSGTVDDPYIIENWSINASTAHAIWIENTDAYFIIRNCYVYDGGWDHSNIFLYNVQNGRVEHSMVTGSWYGIHLHSSSKNTLTNNTVYENDGDGICLDLSSNNTLTDNVIYENNDGIDLDSLSQNNTITNNTVYKNHIGIYLKFSSNNTLTNNTVNGNDWDGFRLLGSSNNTLTNNTVYENSNNNGIGLFSSSNNTITNNMVYGNDDGIYLISSSYNLIYHNNLINNTQNGYDENPANNDWHHPILFEGNYWSDYSGLDEGSGVGKHSIAGDGIGDTLIPHPNSDYDDYPFMDSVVGKPNFNISSNPSSLSLTRPYSGLSSETLAITIKSINGSNSPVSLSGSWVGDVPSGITYSFNPDLITPPTNGLASSLLLVEVSSNASTGTFTLHVTGTDISSHATDVAITVRAPEIGLFSALFILLIIISNAVRACIL